MDTWLYGVVTVAAPGMLLIGALFLMEAIFELLFPKRKDRVRRSAGERQRGSVGRR